MWLTFFASCAAAAEAVKWYNQAGLGDREPEARCYEPPRSRGDDLATDGGDILGDPADGDPTPDWTPDADDTLADTERLNRAWNAALPDMVAQARDGGGDRVPDERHPTQAHQLNLGIDRPKGLKIEECGNPDAALLTTDGYTEVRR